MKKILLIVLVFCMGFITSSCFAQDDPPPPMLTIHVQVSRDYGIPTGVKNAKVVLRHPQTGEELARAVEEANGNYMITLPMSPQVEGKLLVTANSKFFGWAEKGQAIVAFSGASTVKTKIELKWLKPKD